MEKCPSKTDGSQLPGPPGLTVDSNHISTELTCIEYHRTAHAPRIPVSRSFNVRDFGAVGDGIHDDTDAIQDAILEARTFAHTVEGLINAALYQERLAQLISEAASSATPSPEAHGPEHDHSPHDHCHNHSHGHGHGDGQCPRGHGHGPHGHAPHEPGHGPHGHGQGCHGSHMLHHGGHCPAGHGKSSQYPAAHPQIACEVIIPAGIYRVSAVKLTSRIRLVLEKDAVLTASTCPEDYPSITTNIGGEQIQAAPGLISVLGSQNVEICGEGAINGSGAALLHAKSGQVRVRNVLIQDSRKVSINGITMVNSAFCNIHVLNSEKISLSNMLFQWNCGPCTKGIVVEQSSKVAIGHCTFINSGVDNDMSMGVAVLTGPSASGVPLHRVFVSRCSFYNGAGICSGPDLLHATRPSQAGACFPH
ncbi:MULTISPECIES: glycosyl hydrolase family 28-related protein [unclassified Anaerobiospirillum]|uniref:glycosyl hydrolase family 28-related protein n=1 Tax=unclassified Anaerobiospirillum TaxID=2647410 RepID=UPI001FF55433|nr:MULTISPECIES: glycosyl hydrolase family 28-related protein [unclassified Anaerobiospirillum]MCK0534579.1 glycosyl hydrolase family 28 protein [Anaerobiospirillum sp. NML120511]MCK0540617.1 glycosyl hydrolase family 28 protein [Anaerobiospirillum sp. NML02-A-032]